MLADYRNMTEEEILNSRAYWLLFRLRYLDYGVAKFSYLRYTVFGSFILGGEIGIIYSVIFGILAYILGWYAYMKGLPVVEAEMGNQFNLLSKQLRKNIRRDSDGS